MKYLLFLFRNFSRKTIGKAWANTPTIKISKWKDNGELDSNKHSRTKRSYKKDNVRDSSIKSRECFMKSGEIGLTNVDSSIKRNRECFMKNVEIGLPNVDSSIKRNGECFMKNREIGLPNVDC